MLPDASLLRIGLLMIVATGMIQVVAQLVLSRAMEVLPSPPLSRFPRFYMMTHSVTAVVILMIGHILQVTMWALVYHDHWNEFVDLKSALYFSLASFTTLGANDLALPFFEAVMRSFKPGADRAGIAYDLDKQRLIPPGVPPKDAPNTIWFPEEAILAIWEHFRMTPR